MQMARLIQLQSVTKPKGQSSAGAHAHLIDQVQFSRTWRDLSLKKINEKKKKKDISKEAKTREDLILKQVRHSIWLLHENWAKERKKTWSIKTWVHWLTVRNPQASSLRSVHLEKEYIKILRYIFYQVFCMNHTVKSLHFSLSIRKLRCKLESCANTVRLMTENS